MMELVVADGRDYRDLDPSPVVLVLISDTLSLCPGKEPLQPTVVSGSFLGDGVGGGNFKREGQADY